MGNQQTKQTTKQTTTTGPTDTGVSQVGTHGSTTTSQGGWNDRSPQERADQAGKPVDRDRSEMTQGDRTDPAMPSGTTPLERDQRPINQQR